MLSLCFDLNQFEVVIALHVEVLCSVVVSRTPYNMVSMGPGPCGSLLLVMLLQHIFFFNDRDLMFFNGVY